MEAAVRMVPWGDVMLKFYAALAVFAVISVLGVALRFEHLRAEKLKGQVAAITAQLAVAKTNEAAADQRLKDAQAVNAMTKDLTDALQGLPDAKPSARRTALACARLRAQSPGRSLPAVCRPSGSTPPHP